MVRLYSRGCEYVIRALAQVNAAKNGKRFSVKEICEKASLPESYTRKVFQSLVHSGLFEAWRGPGGGYQFKQSPRRISVLKTIRAIDGDDVLEQCVMGVGKCRDQESCALHKKWASIKSKFISEMASVSVEDLIGTKIEEATKP